ncbi:hypothetical protein [Oceanivirga miroungae]|uniref:Uncharacterized protein n=1 Tax=Oceanivirga miroungae TaxID=1130046 RepID=A0A6I8MCU5_9FUSO|nr:hypothetical protein [Oceanivirga miroungae]VWL85260.1 hypothetical protein OMES3154_00543 [Oceanivirga miroungae]
MEIIIYTVLFILFLNISVLVYRIIKKYLEKEDIRFCKNQFIVNNKRVYDLKSDDFNLQFNNLALAMDINFRHFALIKIDLVINEKNQKNKIRNLKNAINILRRLKEYNFRYYSLLISSYFNGNKELIEALEREINNGE